MRWEEMRKAQGTWEEKRTVVISWEELRKGEKTWDGMRWGEKNWEDMRCDELSWDEMGWHRLWWQWDAMSNFREKLRCDEIRWNGKRSNIQKTWHQIDKSRACGCEPQKAWQQAIDTVFVPLYRLPPPACPGIPGILLVHGFLGALFSDTPLSVFIWHLPICARVPGKTTPDTGLMNLDLGPPFSSIQERGQHSSCIGSSGGLQIGLCGIYRTN